MGREYAGTLGYLAFAAVVARGVTQGTGLDGTLPSASAALLIFALVGFLAGAIGESTVRGAVRSRFEEEQRQAQAAETTATASAAT